MPVTLHETAVTNTANAPIEFFMGGGSQGWINPQQVAVMSITFDSMEIMVGPNLAQNPPAAIVVPHGYVAYVTEAGPRLLFQFGPVHGGNQVTVVFG
jgi:hypothetical protein